MVAARSTRTPPDVLQPVPVASLPTWRGHPVPDLLANWFDQLAAADTASLIVMASATRYIDVTLTCASGGGYAKPPQIHLK